jgi:hypothetical protein
MAEPKTGMTVRGEIEVVRESAFAQQYGMVFYEA